MNPRVPDRDALSPRDRRWVEALRAQGPEGPPSSLDAAVLAAARAAVGAKAAPSTGRAGGGPRWLAAVAGVMVVLSAGVLVRQVALETAPRPEPEFPASPPVAAPSPRTAAEERADAVRRATREAEGLPAWETVEAAAPADAEAANAAGAPAPEPTPAPIVGQARSESTMRAQAMEAAQRAPAPPPEPPARPRMAPAPAPVAMPAPSAPAPAPAARSASAAEPVAAAKSAPAAAREQAEAGLAAAASVEQEAGLPEPELLAEVRRLLEAGERELARERLRAWRERHPDALLPSELDALLDERS